MFCNIFKSRWLEPSFSAGNSYNKQENLTGARRDPKLVPPSSTLPPRPRWKLPSAITTIGVGRDPRLVPPSPRLPPGPCWKLPSFSGKSPWKTKISYFVI